MFISTVDKTLSKIAKLTPMVRFPNRTGSVKKDMKPDNLLKLNDPIKKNISVALIRKILYNIN